MDSKQLCEKLKNWCNCLKECPVLRDNGRGLICFLLEIVQDLIITNRSFILANTLAVSALVAFYASTYVISYMLFLSIAFAIIEHDRAVKRFSSLLDIFRENAEAANQVDVGFLKTWRRLIANSLKSPETPQDYALIGAEIAALLFGGFITFKVLKFLFAIFYWINLLLKVVPIFIFVTTLIFAVVQCYRKRKQLQEELFGFQEAVQGAGDGDELLAVTMPFQPAKPRQCLICQRGFRVIFGFTIHHCSKCNKTAFCKFCCPERVTALGLKSISTDGDNESIRVCNACWTETNNEAMGIQNDKKDD